MNTIESMNFRISSYLKTILGKDLITDDYVAVFELVKNSFDARAKKVNICFEQDKIIIIDDGKGMSKDDILNKWAFVAYSAKREGEEDQDYREKINHRYAGSKGVGRFSCDRLGNFLNLQTKKENFSSIQSITVNWDDFEESSKNEFQNIEIKSEVLDAFDLPNGLDSPDISGTVLIITGLRSFWNREKILSLKSALSKLINPFGKRNSEFTIEITSRRDQVQDAKILNTYTHEADVNTKIVNGVIENFIFETLEKKTTWIKSWIENNDSLVTELIDRGKVIYRISEPLQYTELKDSNYEVNIYYLNRSAKQTFAIRMGVPAVDFGSIFLFKNGFRVYPTGNVGDDTFRIDRRKQQGYARFLGTRDVLGRIDISGDDNKFRESSSRDKGLIESDAYEQLIECFKNKTLFRLENYVVGVSWKLKYDQDIDEPSFLSNDDAKSKVISVIAKLSNSKDVKIEYYAEDLLTVVNNKISDFEKTINNLQNLAEKIGNKNLASQARDAFLKYEEMQKAEAEAIAFAERERLARLQAEKIAKETQSRLNITSKELQLEKEKNLFFTSQESRDKDILENMHHQVIIYASNAINHIEATLLEIDNDEVPSKERIKDQYSDLLLIMKRVISASRFATSANFKMEASQITEDLPNFITQYVERICPLFEGRLNLNVNNQARAFVKKFKPIEMSIIIDNLIDNARKARAENVEITISNIENNAIGIDFIDDGIGLSDEIPDPEIIFQKGVTTTGGSGIGLYHVRRMLSSMNGDIHFNSQTNIGGKMTIRIYK